MCNKQHRWAKEIKAWADGATIEYRNTGVSSEWLHLKLPSWYEESFIEYRIKQEEKVMYACQYKNNTTQELNFSSLRDSLEGVKKEWKYCQGATVYGFYKFTAVDSKVIKMEIVK